MRRTGVVKCISAGLILCLGMSLAAGCSGKGKTVDYRVDGVTESAHENGSSGTKGIAQFADAPSWQDEWKAVNTKGNEVTLSVDAKISVPDAEQMYVVDAEVPEMNAGYKEKVAKRIFGDQEVYYNDFAHLPKKELEERRTELLEWMKADGLNAVELNRLGRELKDCEKLLETAKDTYDPIAAYDKDEYLGKRDGVFYKLTFGYDIRAGYIECQSRFVSLEPKDIYQVCPEESRGKVCGYYPGDMNHSAKNQCGLSEESALELAQDFVEELGIGYPVYTHSVPLFWSNDSMALALETMNANDVANGYVFYYDEGIDQVSFPMFGWQEDYENYLKKKKEEQGKYPLNAAMEVYVTDKGVIEMRAHSPIEITGISGEIKLLPLEEVKGIMKEQITEHFGMFRFDYAANNGGFVLNAGDRRVVFNRMELIYFRVSDRKNPGHYSYVPTWRLSEIDESERDPFTVINNPVLINAIDGSVIDFYDEV